MLSEPSGGLVVLEALFPHLPLIQLQNAFAVATNIEEAVRLCQLYSSPDMGSVNFMSSAFAQDLRNFASSAAAVTALSNRYEQRSPRTRAGSNAPRKKGVMPSNTSFADHSSQRNDESPPRSSTLPNFGAASTYFGREATVAVLAAAEIAHGIVTGSNLPAGACGNAPPDGRAPGHHSVAPVQYSNAQAAVASEGAVSPRHSTAHADATHRLRSSTFQSRVMDFVENRVDLMFNATATPTGAQASEYNDTVCVFPIDTSEYDQHYLQETKLAVSELKVRSLPLPSECVAVDEEEYLTAPIIRWAPTVTTAQEAPNPNHRAERRGSVPPRADGGASRGTRAVPDSAGVKEAAVSPDVFPYGAEGGCDPKGVGGIVFVHRNSSDNDQCTDDTSSCSSSNAALPPGGDGDAGSARGHAKRANGGKWRKSRDHSRSRKGKRQVWEAPRDAKTPYQFLQGELERWKLVLSEVFSTSTVFTRDGRCDLVRELIANHRDLVLLLGDFIPDRLLPVVSAFLVGKEVIPRVRRTRLTVPYIVSTSRCLLLSCAPAKIIRLSMDCDGGKKTGRNNEFKGTSASTLETALRRDRRSPIQFISDNMVEVTLRVKELELEPIRFAYQAGTAHPQGSTGRTTAGSCGARHTSTDDDSGSDDTSTLPSASRTEGTVTVKVRNAKVVVCCGCTLWGSGRSFITVSRAAVRIKTLSLKFSVARLHVLAKVLSPFIRGMAESTIRKLLIGRHDIQ